MGREGEVVATARPASSSGGTRGPRRVQQIPWTAAHEKLLTAVVGRLTPDLCPARQHMDPGVRRPRCPGAARAVLAGSSAGLARRTISPASGRPTSSTGRLYGVPWYVDTRVLFYRKDLLARPGTTAARATGRSGDDAMRASSARRARDFAILLPTNEWEQLSILGAAERRDAARRQRDARAFPSAAFRRRVHASTSDLFQRGAAPPLVEQRRSPTSTRSSRAAIRHVHHRPVEHRRVPAPAAGRGAGQLDDGSSARRPDGARARRSPAARASSSSALSATRTRRGSSSSSSPSRRSRSGFYAADGRPARARERLEDAALAGDPYTRAFREQLEHVAPLPQVPEWERIAQKIVERPSAPSAARRRRPGPRRSSTRT